MTGRRILFLDFDGVLCTENYLEHLQAKGAATRDADGTLFDPEAVGQLRRIVDETQCQVVVTSTWRTDGEERIRRLWANRCMPGRLLGVTPVLLHATYEDPLSRQLLEKPEWETKGYEVNAWQEMHGKLDDVYAIVDDENPFLNRQQGHLVQSNEQTGLTEAAASRIIALLKWH